MASYKTQLDNSTPGLPHRKKNSAEAIKYFNMNIYEVNFPLIKSTWTENISRCYADCTDPQK